MAPVSAKKSEIFHAIHELQLRGESEHVILARLADRFSLSETAIWELVQKVPAWRSEMRSQASWESALTLTIARAELAHRLACQAYEDLLNGKYDTNTAHGVSRPSPSTYIAQVISAQKHLADVLRTSQTAQIWSEKKELESQRVGILSQMMAEVGNLTDEELLAEATAMTTEGNEV